MPCLLLLLACLTSREEFQELLAMVEDADGDGFLKRDECDDADVKVNPAAEEEPYDGVDNDCDPLTLDDDLDRDGHLLATDCDDDEPATFDGAEERCDSLDNDCDGQVDEGALRTFYYDGDGDGFGDEAAPVAACAEASTHVATPGDCDDDDPEVNPGAAEVCDDGRDNDCDGGGCRLEGDRVADGLGRTFVGEGHAGGAGVALGGAQGWVLLGAWHDPLGGDRAGAAFLFALAPDGAEDTAAAALTVRGDASGQNLGRSALLAPALGALGPALALGAPGWSEGGASGAVLVFDADARGALGPADAAVELLGQGVMGGALAALRHAEGVDLVVAEVASGQGRALRFDLPAAGTLGAADAEAAWQGAPGEGLGEALLAHDLDGDGLDELVLGAPGLGRALLLDGQALAAGAGLDDALVLSGPAGAGAALAAGDTDGDGLDELAVAADPLLAPEGAVFLLAHPARADAGLEQDAFARLLGDTPGEGLGAAIALSDLDADGHDDLAAGAPDGGDGGHVRVFYGPLSGALDTPALRLVADSAGDDLGFALLGGLDLDGEGPEDLLVGAPNHGGGGFRPGAAFLLAGQGF